MELETIKTRGRDLGLSEFVLHGPRRTLIQAIQQAEGRKTCFRSEDSYQCRNFDCEWRADCQKLTAAWRR